MSYTSVANPEECHPRMSFKSVVEEGGESIKQRSAICACVRVRIRVCGLLPFSPMRSEWVLV